MNVESPIVDRRTEKEVLDALHNRAPGFTPEWTPRPSTADEAFGQIFARFTGIFLEGLRKVPKRGFLAFLENAGVSLLPGESARAPLVFTLMENATTDPLLAVNSQVAAPTQAPPPSPLVGDEARLPMSASAIFSTEKEIILARARLAALYSVDPASDKVADYSSSVASGFTLFGDLKAAVHELYLGHDKFFALAANAKIRLSIQLASARTMATPLVVEWEYLSKDGWLPLSLGETEEEKVSHDGTKGLTQDGVIVLTKTCGPDAAEDEIPPKGARSPLKGAKSYWIRGCLRTPLQPVGNGESGDPPVLDDIRAEVNFVKSDLLAEAAATDLFLLDITAKFLPFGQQPALYTTFYLASKEVFQRGGARVSIQIDLVKGLVPSPTSPIRLAWEYFDGESWRSLDGFEFRDDTKSFTVAKGALSFICPPDWRETLIAGVSNYWMRARIDAGDYGHPLQLSAEEVTGSNPKTYTVKVEKRTLDPPIISALKLQYTYKTNLEPLDRCIALNDFVYTDYKEACLWPRQTFAPFQPIAEEQPAVHFGFDQPLPSGLVSLFVYIAPDAEKSPADETPAFIWEYRDESGWSDLGVLDETVGFSRSEMIQFIGPSDAVPVQGLGGSLYRIRARLKLGARMSEAKISGLWMNAVWATHRSFVKTEELGVSDGNPLQTLYLRPQRVPILEDEIIEVREWVGRGSDWETAVQGIPAADLRYRRDPSTDAITEVWVRWHRQPYLSASGAAARDYVIERSIGSLRLGDGTHGRIPSSDNRVVASYYCWNDESGGGLAGNVPVDTITELRSAVPYLKSVGNPLSASGGAGSEILDAVPPRGAQQFRHGGRAVSATDIEWLARNASSAVARAHCLSTTGPVGHVQRGWITIVVLPHGSEAQPSPTSELIRRVRDHVAASTPASVSRARVRVIAPTYVPVGVIATVVSRSPDDAARVEARLLLRLNRFLHPLTGGPNPEGWAFGQTLHLSQVATLLEETEGVDYVLEMVLRIGTQCLGESVPVGREALIAAGDHEIKLALGER